MNNTINDNSTSQLTNSPLHVRQPHTTLPSVPRDMNAAAAGWPGLRAGAAFKLCFEWFIDLFLFSGSMWVCTLYRRWRCHPWTACQMHITGIRRASKYRHWPQPWACEPCCPWSLFGPVHPTAITSLFFNSNFYTIKPATLDRQTPFCIGLLDRKLQVWQCFTCLLHRGKTN